MSFAGDLFFYVCASVALLCAVATIFAKSPIRAALGLLGHIISLAGIYLTLHAHFVAALQLIVYAGAVVVLFIFVIMLIGPTPIAPGNVRGLVTRTTAAVVAGIVVSSIAFSVVSLRPERAAIAACAPGAGAECGQFGGVEGLGKALFSEGLLPFELISFLLLVAIIGAIAVARGRSALEVAEAKVRRRRESAALKQAVSDERALAAEIAAELKIQEAKGH